MTIPGIWESVPTGESERRTTTCEIVVTNQHLLGYMHTRFPRERLFLEAFALKNITKLAFRQRSFDPLFRELSLSDDTRTAYIRSSREKIELLYQEIQTAIATYAPHATKSSPDTDEETPRPAPVYERRTIRTTFEQSSLGITALFVGGLLLEIIGIIAWALTQSIQVGLPLCLAGLFAVFVATLSVRLRR